MIASYLKLVANDILTKVPLKSVYRTFSENIK
jgi:hypothetical protein